MSNEEEAYRQLQIAESMYEHAEHETTGHLSELDHVAVQTHLLMATAHLQVAILDALKKMGIMETVSTAVTTVNTETRVRSQDNGEDDEKEEDVVLVYTDTEEK
jgi:hypothetical protein